MPVTPAARTQSSGMHARTLNYKRPSRGTHMLRRIGTAAFLLTLLLSAANAQGYRDRDGDRFRDRDGDRFGDRRGDGPANWVPLGCRDVDLFGTDRDTIRVGRGDGRFRAIRLRSVRGGVDVIDVRVMYVNGEPDHL